jgi:putative membrane protein
MQPTFNWSQPQRQPLSGLLVALLKSFGQVLKSTWPFILLALFRGQQKEFDGYDATLLAAAAIVLISSLGSYFFFRFYIEGDELIIKKGWLKKQVLTIPLQKIQAVHIEQGPLHQLLNIVKLSADTAGSNKTEVTIDALRKPMAEALRERLSQHQQPQTESGTEAVTPLFTLGEKDLLKLAISANHVEAFFLLLSFAYGIFDNIKTINEDLVDDAAGWMPAGTLPVLLFLISAVLVTTLLISTTRIFFKFYQFTAMATPSGFGLKSGLASTRERFVAFQKIHYISWRSNWVRQRLGLWLLQFHTVGGNEVKQTVKAEVPVTQKSFISLLVQPYHTLPDTTGVTAVRIHASYILHRTLIVGLIPAFILMAATVYWWQYNALLWLLWPAWMALCAWRFQRKFRLWVYDEVLYISRGVWGVEKVLLKWSALQATAFTQNIYQRNRGLANVLLYTAAGTLVIPFIDAATALPLVNYGLYKVEKEMETFS